MLELLLVLNGAIITLCVGVLVYIRIVNSQFQTLITKQKEDMAKFSELHQATLKRNKNYEEEMAKLITSVNDLKTRPLNTGFGVNKNVR